MKTLMNKLIYSILLLFISPIIIAQERPDSLLTNAVGNLDLMGVQNALKKGANPKSIQGSEMLDYMALLKLSNDPSENKITSFKEIFKLLRSRGLKFEGNDFELGAIIKIGNADLLQYLIESGLNPHGRPDGYTSIEYCILNGKDNLISVIDPKKILRRPTEQEIKQLELMKAIKSGDKETIKIAISKGSNPDEKDSSGRTPLGYLLGEMNVKPNPILILWYIKEFDASLNTPSYWMMKEQGLLYPIHFLVLTLNDSKWEQFGKILLGVFLQRGAKLDVMDGFKSTPLHWASRLGRVSIVKDLLECGANKSIKDSTGKTADMVAKTPEIATLIISYEKQ
ncbi:MAG: ankyrin repeat domain-containing protein [Chloroflexota bacterium]